MYIVLDIPSSVIRDITVGREKVGTDSLQMAFHYKNKTWKTRKKAIRTN